MRATHQRSLPAAAMLCVLLTLSLTACAAKASTPPHVAFSAPGPVDGASVLRDVKFQVTANASDGQTIAKVEFLIDGVQPADAVDTTAPYEYHWVAGGKFGVARKVTAIAYDNTGASASTSIEVKFFDGVEKAPMPTSRYAFTSDVVNNKIYVIGGHDFHFNLVEAYDPATNTWSTKAPSKFLHAAHTSCVIDGKIYVFGGGTDKEWVSDVESYDPATDTWTTKSPLPVDQGASQGMNSCAVVNGKAYILGGLADPEPARVAEYDPASDHWRVSNSVAPSFSAKALSLNNLIYFMGGCEFRSMGQCDHPYDSLQTYDPLSDAWTKHNPMLTSHTNQCATLLDGKIYVMGGGSLVAANAALADKHVEVYDPAKDTWTAVPGLPMLDTLANFGCNSVNGKIYIIAPEHTYEYSPDQGQ